MAERPLAAWVHPAWSWEAYISSICLGPAFDAEGE
jgi:hypothetical protein